MANYDILAKINQIVTKEVRLSVSAGSEEEAIAKATEALQTYPKAIVKNGIRRILTTKSNYWIPRDIDIVTVKEEKEAA